MKRPTKAIRVGKHPAQKGLLGVSPARGTEAVMKAQLITAVLKGVEAQRLTHAEVAKRSGLPRSAVTGILSGSLKAHLSEKIRGLGASGRPLVVTQNGKAAAVMLAPEEFDGLTTQARFVTAVQQGLDDLDAGRVVSHHEVGDQLDARFGALTEPK
jgi:PHD/YefM family antitoxin component YafN of YafNO toxin-antitoxin module